MNNFNLKLQDKPAGAYFHQTGPIFGQSDVGLELNAKWWHGSNSIPVPEFIDPVFAKTSTKRSFSVIEYERFRLVFAKTGSINSGTVAEFIDPDWGEKVTPASGIGPSY
jgi:hypothetical protein